MATLIPAIGSCVARMTSGEKRFAWPSTQYDAVLIDDAQSICNGPKKLRFSFSASACKRRAAPPSSNSSLCTVKGLEFPLVCMPAIGGPAGEEQVLEDEARLLYVGMTRATEELVMTHHEESMLGEKVRTAMGVLERG